MFKKTIKRDFMEKRFINEVLDTYELENEKDMIFEILPRDYNTPALFAKIEDIPNLPDKMNVTVFGYISSFEKKILSGRKALVSIKAKLYRDGHSINLNWTTSAAKANSMLFGLKMKSPEDQIIQVSGKIKSFDIGKNFIYKFIDQPILNVITGADTNKEILMPEPIYKLKSSSNIKSLQIQNAFRELVEQFEFLDKSQMLPEKIEKELEMNTLKDSLTYVHGLKGIPLEKFQDFLSYEGYRRRILIEKIWRIMFDNFYDKNSTFEENVQFISKESINNIKEILEKLHFQLTGDQKKAVWGLLNVFAKKTISKNLIFGDVGSGKTMVSLIVSYVLYRMGFQVVIMTPTSILARQHYEEAVKLLGEEVLIELVHSKTTKKQKKAIQDNLDKKKAMILYGTSSLNGFEYSNLGAVFIDEEQKFGVKDKEKLHKNYNTNIVYMTATPIPRTLASSMYTDFEIFKIEEKPAMQKPRITKIINELSDSETAFIKSKIKEGEQVLVIVPAIASNDLVSSAFAEKKYAKLFSEFKIDKINGRMKPQNIEKTTENFMSGKIDILIATTMVDAGFSNKNLSFVFIENADRFGIAQMHQIRGRVGRAEKQGYCYLIPASKNLKEKTKQRLESLVESENGFELSMKDIELRGSGDVRGLEQSGSEVNLLDWIKEIEVINKYLKENY